MEKILLTTIVAMNLLLANTSKCTMKFNVPQRANTILLNNKQYFFKSMENDGIKYINKKGEIASFFEGKVYIKNKVCKVIIVSEIKNN